MGMSSISYLTQVFNVDRRLYKEVQLKMYRNAARWLEYNTGDTSPSPFDPFDGNDNTWRVGEMYQFTSVNGSVKYCVAVRERGRQYWCPTKEMAKEVAQVLVSVTSELREYMIIHNGNLSNVEDTRDTRRIRMVPSDETIASLTWE